MKNIKKKILVTGGTGFIGSSIVNLLLTMKKEVVVYDNNFRGKIKRLALNQKKIKLIKGDIRDLKKLKSINWSRYYNSFGLYKWNKVFLY